MERIGNETAGAELQGDARLAVDLGEQHVADRGVGRVERGQPPEEPAVVGSGAADRHVAAEQVLVEEVACHRVLLSRFGSDDPMLRSTGTENQGQFNANF
jgi:hypothetical protein